MNKKHWFFGVVSFVLLAGIGRSQGPVFNDTLLNSRRLGPVTERIDVQAYQDIWHVSSENGSDKKGDGSREKPWKTINHGLEKAAGATADHRCALIIASGRYAEKTLVMQKHTDLFGGYDARIWERDIFANKTILDGQGVRGVVLGADSARLDGFFIINGLSDTHGGGILCDDTSPEISNNIVRGNTVMGPVSFNTSRIHQEGIHGGGIACRFNAVPVIRNNLILENRTAIGNGAGIAFYGWVRKPGIPETETIDNRLSGGIRAQVVNNIIMFNKAGVNDLYRTRSSNGGGISAGFEARPLILNNLIAMNDAGGRGDAGGIYIEYFADPDVVGNWILGNTSDDDGGGLYTMRLGQPLIENNIFSGNYTRSGGAGAIRISKEGRAAIKSNLVVRNRGGGITSVDSYAEIHDNIIAQNTGRPGISISNKFTYLRPSVIDGNIFADNPEGNISVTGTKDVEIRPQDPESGGIIIIETEPMGISEAVYDENTDETMVFPADASRLDSGMTGKVVRIGEKWSLVKDVSDKGLVVWGDLTVLGEDQKILEFLPVYDVETSNQEEQQ